MTPIITVIAIVLMTYCDTLLIISSAVRNVSVRPQTLIYAMFVTLSVTHPIYSLIVEYLARMPGLRIATAAITLLFAFSLAGSRMAYRSITERSFLSALWKLLWMDLVMCVDTIVLISQASPSVVITVIGNMVGIAVLLLFTPFALRLLRRAVWIQVVVAGCMAYAAARQLGGEPYLSSFIQGPVLHMTGLLFICAVILYGWRQIRRFY